MKPLLIECKCVILQACSVKIDGNLAKFFFALFTEPDDVEANHER